MKRILIVFLNPNKGRPETIDAINVVKLLKNKFDLQIDILCLQGMEFDNLQDAGIHLIYMPNQGGEYAILCNFYKNCYEKIYREYLSQSKNIYSKIRGKIKQIIAEMNLRKPDAILSLTCVNTVYALINKLLDGKQYDLIISFSLPEINHDISMMLMHKKLGKKWIIIEYEPIVDRLELDKGCFYREENWYNRSTKIFIPKVVVKNAKKSSIQKFEKKIFYTPVHFLTNMNCCQHGYANNETTIRLLYSGGFNKNGGRNPFNLCKIMEKTPGCYQLVLCSRYCDDEINKFYHLIESGKIQQKGYVDIEVLEKEMNVADAFISLGNVDPSLIPSKVLSYIQTGKPIIHFTNTENDPVKELYSSYPLIKFIEYNSNYKTAADEIIDFLEISQKRHVTFNEVAKLYPDQTLETICNQIIRHLD